MGIFSRLAKGFYGGAVAPAERLSEYFAAAVYAHLLHDDEAARAAAFAAGALADRLQRSGMIAFLEKISVEMRLAQDGDGLGDGAIRQRNAAKLDSLAKQLGEHDWTLQEAIAARLHLSKLDPEYAAAMSGQDAAVFKRRYPDRTQQTTSSTNPPELTLLTEKLSKWADAPPDVQLRAAALFLKREYQDQFPTYSPDVFAALAVAIGQEAERRKKSGEADTPVVAAALIASLTIAYSVQQTGHLDDKNITNTGASNTETNKSFKTCPQCGGDNDLTFKFCGHCAHPLEQRSGATQP